MFSAHFDPIECIFVAAEKTCARKTSFHENVCLYIILDLSKCLAVRGENNISKQNPNCHLNAKKLCKYDNIGFLCHKIMNFSLRYKLYYLGVSPIQNASRKKYISFLPP